MRIAVYRTIFGGYENIKPIPKQSVDFDYYCITDNPDLTADGCTSIVPQYPRMDLHARLRAKYFKLFPFEIKELSEYDITIYIDGSIDVVNGDFVKWCVENLKGDMLLFKHPERRCIYDEFNASKELNKYKYEMQDIQMINYSQFYPRKAGLFACGVLVRRYSDVLRDVMLKWWFEIIKYSWQDQVSFPVVCKLLGFVPDTFKENQYRNDYFKVIWHDDKVEHRPGITPLNDAYGELKVSVLMPVYNTPVEFLILAIDSILTQTYTDFEFVIVDDNNKDAEVIKTIGYYYAKDSRIRIIKRGENKGIAAALNDGLKECSGNLIIRMDSDDVAHKLLIEKQVGFFLRNKEAVICGVQISMFGPDIKGNPITNHAKVNDASSVKNSNSYWIINHPGVAFKKDIVMNVGAYGDIPAHLPEDWYLWCNLLHQGFKIYNMQDVLIYYRYIQKPERSKREWTDFLIKCKNSI